MSVPAPSRLDRRRSVMSRSMRLGHCVCNPANPCPCDVFKQHNVCPCAGERLPVAAGPVALTRHVERTGCASKVSQADLLRVLAQLPPVHDPNVLLGTAAGDDAGIYRLSDDTALVLTVDVFTPPVDDAYLFGQIAAANSVSDVYAMGGRPLAALSIIGYPVDTLGTDGMAEILRGGLDKLNEAGCALVGGHSIQDDEIKCGFAVTGLMHPHQVVQRGAARPGDALVLTKPLGTGIVAFGMQIGRATAAELEQVGRAMATLNKDAAELMLRFGAHACTDITGFGLAGHLAEMARGSGVTVEIDLGDLPIFPAALRLLEEGVYPGAVERNEEYAMAWVCVPEDCADARLPAIYDPQTSGGLLVSLPADAAGAYEEAMRGRGHAAAAIVGAVRERRAQDAQCRVVITGQGKGAAAAAPATAAISEKEKDVTEPTGHEEAGPSCCSPKEASAPSVGGLATFGAFMAEANREGAIDRRGKKLMAIALSVSQRCRPCLVHHVKEALKMGIAKAEIDEAATLAVAFAGCPSMMMYKEVCMELGLA